MWHLSKTVIISASHKLRNYKGPCAELHGHNWKITISCKSNELGSQGMLIDFKRIKEIVNEYDHTDLNSHSDFRNLNPTAENIACILCHKIPYCYQVLVEEQEGSICLYVKD